MVIGSGLAGLYAAHKASAYGPVLVVTKKALRDSNSYNAQGGIAAVTDIEDNPEIHFTDTVIAGRGLCENRAVEVLVQEGPQRIKEIIGEGMKFDTENGKLSLGLREATPPGGTSRSSLYRRCSPTRISPSGRTCP